MPSSRPLPPNAPPQTPYYIALGMSEALRYPYAQPAMNQFHNSYSTHYVNAYLQAQQLAHTTSEGYTLSSTYDPRATMYRGNSGHQVPSSIRGRGQGHRTQASNIPRQPIQQRGSWYQPGNSRCTYHSCSFSGSSKAVEIHMMDRHLIYPPGWVQKKKGSDWDADPSLKGCIYTYMFSWTYLTNSIFSRKMVPIQGTSVVLNTPEALDAWLAERKKRWPTAQRIEEKKKKMEEAVVRGQLPLVSNSFRGTKRPREGRKPQWNNTHRHKLSAQTKRQKTQDTQDNQTIDTHSSIEVPKVASGSKISFDVQCPDDDNDSNDDNEAPEVISSKSPIGQLLSVEQESSNVSKDATEASAPSELLNTKKKFIRPRKREPKLPSRNPFAARPTLLRNVRFSCKRDMPFNSQKHSFCYPRFAWRCPIYPRQ